jgi:ketosteroid isomerase-like protein
VLTTTTGPVTAAADHAAVAELIAVDKAMQASFVTRDVAALARILSDDYLLLASNGNVYRKSDVLAKLRSPDSHWDVNETSDWNVHVHGDVAVVVATLHQKGSDQGEAFDSRVRFCDAYVREQGRWQNIHAFACRVVGGSAIAAVPADGE